MRPAPTTLYWVEADFSHESSGMGHTDYYTVRECQELTKKELSFKIDQMRRGHDKVYAVARLSIFSDYVDIATLVRADARMAKAEELQRLRDKQAEITAEIERATK